MLPLVPGRVWAINLAFCRGVITQYLVKGEGYVLIDAGTPLGLPRTLALIERELNVTPDRLLCALLTHGHPDHAGGASAFQESMGKAVRVHPADRGFVNNFEGYIAGGTGDSLDAFSELGWGSQTEARKQFLREHIVDGAIPLVPISGGAGIDIGCGRSILAIHTPGHSPGSLAFWLEPDGVLFVGDSVQGFGVRGAWQLYADVDQATRSLQHLQAVDPATMAAAHVFDVATPHASAQYHGPMAAELITQTLAGLDLVGELTRACEWTTRGATAHGATVIFDSAAAQIRARLGRVVAPTDPALITTVLAHLRQAARHPQKAQAPPPPLKDRTTPGLAGETSQSFAGSSRMNGVTSRRGDDGRCH